MTTPATDTITIDVTPQQLLEEWCSEMESGDWAQAQGSLVDSEQHDDNVKKRGHCCLGVFLRVAANHGLVEWNEDDYANTVPGLMPLLPNNVQDDIQRHGDSTNTELPSGFAAWVGMDCNPVLNYDNDRAVHLNDEVHADFASIARQVRSYVLPRYR